MWLVFLSTLKPHKFLTQYAIGDQDEMAKSYCENLGYYPRENGTEIERKTFVKQYAETGKLLRNTTILLMKLGTFWRQPIFIFFFYLNNNWKCIDENVFIRVEDIKLKYWTYLKQSLKFVGFFILHFASLGNMVKSKSEIAGLQSLGSWFSNIT